MTQIEFKYCPLCATELIYRPLFGRQRQQCPACDWIHFRDPKVGVGVLMEQDGGVILVKRGVQPAKGLWCLPSGFMEFDESPEETAVRECKEETGLDIRLTGLLDVFHYTADFRGAGVMILYRAEVIGGQRVAMDDAVEIASFGPDDLPHGEIAFRSNEIALERWRQAKSKTNRVV